MRNMILVLAVWTLLIVFCSDSWMFTTLNCLRKTLKAMLCKLNWTCQYSLPCITLLTLLTCLITTPLLNSIPWAIDGHSSRTTRLTDTRSSNTSKIWKLFWSLSIMTSSTNMTKIMLWSWARVPLVISTSQSWLSHLISNLSILWSNKILVKRSFLMTNLIKRNIFMFSTSVKTRLIMLSIMILKL